MCNKHQQIVHAADREYHRYHHHHAAPYLSCAPVLTKPSFFTTVIPEHTRPKIVCLPSNHGVGASVMKNWLRLVFGPAFACSIAHAGKTAASLQ